MISKPTWCYRKINHIPKLDLIQKELLTYMCTVKPDIENWQTEAIYMPKDKIIDHVPLFNEYLQSLGVYDRWVYSLLTYTNNSKSLPIHVDSTRYEHRCYALNIPTLNCENTYTVWYDAEIDNSMERSMSDNQKYLDIQSDNITSSARRIIEGSKVVEIDRVETSNCVWINHTIPHNGISYHNLPRGMFSTRFGPELHDIIDTL